ncbi:MAG: ADOP family duplicated permease [Acidobacteriota bacterium]
MQPTLQDLRTAARNLLRSPSRSLVSILVLGLAIGANSSMFSLVDTLLLSPLPIPEPDRISLVLQNDVEERNYGSVSYPDYVDLRDAVQTFDGLAAHILSMVAVGEGADARRGFVDIVSSNYFDTFGVPLARGRTFTAEEETQAGEWVAILSYQSWQRRGGTDDVIGTRLLINGTPTTIVGVAPRGFSGTSTLLAPEIYMPLGLSAAVGDSLGSFRNADDLFDRRNRQLLLVGRRSASASEALVNEDLARVSALLAEAHPASNENLVYEAHPPSRISISTAPQEDDELGVLSGLLLSMSLIVLLVAGINLAALQDASNLARRREIGTRLALGAKASRVVRWLLFETLLLSMGGALLGLAVATTVPRLLETSLARMAPFDIYLRNSVDWRIVAATLAFAALASLLVGLFPALRATRADLVSDLKQGGDSSGSKRRRFGLARGDLPVAAQIAFSTVLLVCAGLFVLSTVRSASVDPGFDTETQIIAEVDPGLAGYDKEQVAVAQERLRDAVSRLPEVRQVAFAATTPFGMSSSGVAAADADATPNADGALPARGAAFYAISDSYFSTLEIPVVAGREFRADEPTAVAIIDELMAERLFGQETALGRRIVLPNSERLEGSAEVVGVVATVRDRLFDASPQAHVYLPAARTPFANTQMHIATYRAPDTDLVTEVRNTLRATDAQVPVLLVKTFSDFLDGNFEIWALRTGAQLFGAFALLALALATAGVYGVQAYRVARSTREIGLRMALGASAGGTLTRVLRNGLRVAAIGVALGTALAVAVSRLLDAVTVGVDALEPMVLGTTVLGLLVVAALACLAPALRAARLNPLEALRDS